MLRSACSAAHAAGVARTEAMALGNYPWQATKPGRSRVFDWVYCWAPQSGGAPPLGVGRCTARGREMPSGTKDALPVEQQ